MARKHVFLCSWCNERACRLGVVCVLTWENSTGGYDDDGESGEGEHGDGEYEEEVAGAEANVSRRNGGENLGGEGRQEDGEGPVRG